MREASADVNVVPESWRGIPSQPAARSERLAAQRRVKIARFSWLLDDLEPTAVPPGQGPMRSDRPPLADKSHRLPISGS
jgi:hypothetical protein